MEHTQGDHFNALNFVSTDDLLDELMGRFDHFVCAGMKVRPLREGEEDAEDGQLYEKKRTKGNTRVCQGLCFALMVFQQTQFDAGATDCDGDDPLV